MSENTERIIIEIDDSGVYQKIDAISGGLKKVGDSADETNKKIKKIGDVDTKPSPRLLEINKELWAVADAAKMSAKQIEDMQQRLDKAGKARDLENALKALAQNANLSTKELKELGRQAGIANKSISDMAETMSTKLSLAAKAKIAGAVTTVTIAFKQMMANAIEAEQAQAQLQAALRSTGEAAGFSQSKLGLMANEIAKSSTFSVTEITKAQTVMTTYSNVVGENYTRAMRVVADQSARLGISMQQSAEMIGRSLDVPAEGMNSLVRQGFRFTEAQKAMVKELQDSGRVMEAQQFVLEALEESYKGSAEAARNTFGGALSSLKSAISDVTSGREGSFDAATAGINAFSDALRDKETIEGISSLIELVGGLAAGLAGIAKYANLRSISSTYAEGIALARKGLIDLEKFNKATLLERQEMVDAYKDSTKIAAQHVTAIWQQAEKENLAAYNQFVYQREQTDESSRRKADEWLQEQTQRQKSAYQQLTDEYNKQKEFVTDKVALEVWYQNEVKKLRDKEAKESSSAVKKTVKSLKEIYAATLHDVDPRTQMEFSHYIEQAEKEKQEKIRLEEEYAQEALSIKEAQEKEGLRIMERIQDATADIFYDLFQDIGKGWDKLWDSMKSWALRTLAELAARAATVQIVVPIMTTITGTNSANAAVSALTGGGASGLNLSSLSSLVQPGSLLSKIPGFGAISSLLATQLPGTTMLSGGALALQSGLTAGGDVASLAAAQNLAGMTGGLSLGPALGMGGLGGLGYSLLGGAFGLPQSKWSGLTASLGGTLGAWGGSALGATLGATAGSVVPVIGTAVGALAGGLLSSAFGKKQHSPSIIFDAQEQAWGDVSDLAWHTKSGARRSTGEEISRALGEAVTPIFEEVENLVGIFGEQYVEELQKKSVYFGRGWGSWDTWDFGSDHDFEKTFEKAVQDVRGQILKAAAPTISVAGQEYLAGEGIQELLSMLESPDLLMGQYSMLQGGIPGIDEATRQFLATGKDVGFDVDAIERYVAELQSLQQVLAEVAMVWGTISQASHELINPLTEYEAAQRAVNIQYDEWVMQLEALGIATEKINEIEADRETLLQRLYDDSQKAIADVTQASANVIQPLKEYEQAQVEIGQQYDAWIEQLRQLGATLEQTQALEADREQALRNLAIANREAIDDILGSAHEVGHPLTRLESKLRDIDRQFDGWSDSLAEFGATARDVEALESSRQVAILSAMTEDLIEAFNAEIAGLDKIISEHDSRLTLAHRNLAQAYNREASELRQISDRFAFLGKQINDWINSFWAGQDSPLDTIQKTTLLLENFQSTMRMALGGDETALESLPDAATDYLTTGRETTGSRADYIRMVGDVSRQMSGAELTAIEKQSTADRQLQTLEAQAKSVDGILNESVSFAVAFSDYRSIAADVEKAAAIARREQIKAQLRAIDLAAQTADNSAEQLRTQIGALKEAEATKNWTRLGYEKQEQVRSTLSTYLGSIYSQLRQVVAYMTPSEPESSSVASFASGGYHHGGLRVVGERGPELEVTGPSRIWSAEETREILMGGGQSQLVLEIAQLRSELQAANFAIAKNTADTSKMLRRWDGDGMPEERAM